MNGAEQTERFVEAVAISQIVACAIGWFLFRVPREHAIGKFLDRWL